MRYCEYCGAPLDDDALFCTKCGSKLSPLESTSAPVQTPIAGPSEDIQQPAIPPVINKTTSVGKTTPIQEQNIAKKNHIPLYIVAGAVLAVLVGIGIYLFAIKNDDNKDDDEEETLAEVIMPDFDKFVLVENACLYAKPDTNSPRLMLYCTPDEEDPEGNGCWIEWENRAYVDNHTEATERWNKVVAPVTDEKDGWYQIWYSGDRWGGMAFRGYVWVKRSDAKDAKLVMPPFEESPKAPKYCDYEIKYDDSGGVIEPILIRRVGKYNVELQRVDGQNTMDIFYSFGNYWEGLTDEQYEAILPCFSNKAAAIEVMVEGDRWPTTIFLNGFDDEGSFYEGSTFENQLPSHDGPLIIQGDEGEEYFGTTTVDVFRWEGE